VPNERPADPVPPSIPHLYRDEPELPRRLKSRGARRRGVPISGGWANILVRFEPGLRNKKESRRWGCGPPPPALTEETWLRPSRPFLVLKVVRDEMPASPARVIREGE